MKNVTQSTNADMYIVSTTLFLGAVLALLPPRGLVNRYASLTFVLRFCATPLQRRRLEQF